MTLWQISPAYFKTDDLLIERTQLIAEQAKDTRQTEYNRRLKLIDTELALRGCTNFDGLVADNDLLKKIAIAETTAQQFAMLTKRYHNKAAGRIALPHNAVALWTQHKYAIMARSISLYKAIGKTVATNNDQQYFTTLAKTLTDALVERPTRGMLLNALQHMWGYIADVSTIKKCEVHKLKLNELLSEIQHCALKINQPYLLKQVALSELAIWLDDQ